MIANLNSIVYMLAQNQLEKNLTIVGITLFSAFIFFLIVDSLIKGKFVPKKKDFRGFLIFVFILTIIAIILLIIYYKWLEI